MTTREGRLRIVGAEPAGGAIDWPNLEGGSGNKPEVPPSPTQLVRRWRRSAQSVSSQSAPRFLVSAHLHPQPVGQESFAENHDARHSR